jgi:CMP-N-acetylneuraminic acid synthetase
VYVTRCAAIGDYGNLYGKRSIPYIMPPERSVNIDSLIDLHLAEYYLNQA